MPERTAYRLPVVLFLAGRGHEASRALDAKLREIAGSETRSLPTSVTDPRKPYKIHDEAALDLRLAAVGTTDVVVASATVVCNFG
jgi:hypothetical protein